MPGKRQVILFGRYPAPGRTKTRLIPALGPVGAADLQRRLTETSLSTVLKSGIPASAVIFCHTGGSPGQVMRWLGRTGVGFDKQTGADLGVRMRNALWKSLSRGFTRVVLVGTDIPGMTEGHIRAALDALEGHDLVLGPSRDGGYWLIGANRPVDVFQGIHWGGPHVMDQTLAAAAREGLSTALLEALNDIDTESDLQDWRPAGHWRKPYLTVVIPALNEAPTIATAIDRVRSADSEILVVDGGSRDATPDLARAAGARVITAPRGRAVQQNRGASQASGRVLLFLHADTLLPPDYVAQVFETLLDPSVTAGAFRFKTDYSSPGMRLIELAVHLRSTLFQLPYGDQGLFMPRPVFEKAGGFPLVPIAEDLMLARRLGRIGQARGTALTSGRRWRAIGVWRATLINYLIAGGCLMGVDPQRLARLYRLWLKPEFPEEVP